MTVKYLTITIICLQELKMSNSSEMSTIKAPINSQVLFQADGTLELSYKLWRVSNAMNYSKTYV